MTRCPFSSTRFYAAFFALLLAVFFAAIASGATLRVPALEKGKPGDLVTLPVVVDRVEKLAGIKLELQFDNKILKFVRAEKTTHTANMLYVVNDKTSGKLVIVMAAAQGFTAENAELVQLSFELLADVKAAGEPFLQIIKAELMSDDLKRIPVN